MKTDVWPFSVHENVFASGGSDGSIMFWNVGSEKEVGVIEQVSCLVLSPLKELSRLPTTTPYSELVV